MNRTGLLRWIQTSVDVMVLSVALWSSVFMRFEGDAPLQILKRVLFLWPYIVTFQYLLLVVLGIPRFSWRHVGLREAVRILGAVLIGSTMLVAVRLVAAELFSLSGPVQYAHLPLGIIAIDFVLAFLGLSGVRVVRRLSTERSQVQRLRPSLVAPTPTLLVGAGSAGLMIAKEIGRRPELGIEAIGFIDDNPAVRGTVVHGIRVLGAVADVDRIAHERGAKQAIITIASAPGSVVRNISETCQRAGLKVKVIPGLYQIVSGDLNLTRIRDVAIEDLLRRESVVLDDQAISDDLRGRVVMVTGAGGSIGSEICRQVARFEPKQLVLVERAENALFEIHRELRADFPSLALQPAVADICDRTRIEDLFRTLTPEVVFHAAAHKHVPMMEWNPAEAVKNNVFGTRLLTDVANAYKVRAFVMISTDKAVNPSSVMGATKRVAEMYVQSLAARSVTRFVTVRFGNVLGSNGSVVPIFKEQIARGGPVTVTHPDMKRYFMTIPEACQLVLQAGSMGRGGEIFILDMGEPVKILDLALDLIQLSGFARDEIQVVFTGMRPGEKLYEELSLVGENAEKTRHPKIFIGRSSTEPMDALLAKLDELRAGADVGVDEERIRKGLAALVPDYKNRPTA